MPSNHLILCHPLLLLPSIFPRIRVFSNESALRIRWPQYWSFSFNISPSKEHPRLISFRMDWLGLLAVQETPRSLLQHHSSKTSILRHSTFFIVQLSHPYMTTGKAIALTRQTFVDKVMSLLLNMLSRLVITFLPRSKHLLISWPQSPYAVILEPRKIKSATVSHFPICFPWSEALGAGGERDNRGWDGWMASPTWWTWIWVNSRSWWWTGRPGVLQFMGSQRVGHDWATELNWTELMGLDATILVFWTLSFKPTFSLSPEDI